MHRHLEKTRAFSAGGVDYITKPFQDQEAGYLFLLLLKLIGGLYHQTFSGSGSADACPYSFDVTAHSKIS